MNGESIEVRSEARGSHWVAWVIPAGQGVQPASILMVGRTREEAEDRMRTWWASYLAISPPPPRA